MPGSSGLRRFIPAGAGNTWPDTLHDFHDVGLSPLARGTLMPQMYPYFVFRFIPAGAGNTDRRHNGWVAYAVYPRWRGEHKSAIHALTLYPGLSPLARGTRDGALIEKFFCRFIPAGAGNTASLNVNGVYTAVYPRWRGEHLTSKAAPISGGGLSPLARGTHKAGYTSIGTGRFIPAGAGNTPRD